MWKSCFALASLCGLSLFGLQTRVKADEIIVPEETCTPDLSCPWAISPWVINSILDGSSCAPASWKPFEHDEPEEPGDPPVAQPPFQLTGSPPTLGQNFAGDSLESYPIGPSDTMGAVGPNQFMEVTNYWVSVYEKANGQRIASESLPCFFSGLGTAGNFGDPRVLFDQHSERWIVIASDFYPEGRIALAVSLTPDPRGDFFKTYFVAAAGSDAGDLVDYPTLGVDENGIYISADMWGDGETVWAIDKAPLIADPPSMGTITVWRGLGIGVNQPAHTYGTPGSQYIIGAVRDEESALHIYRIDPPLTAPTMWDTGTVPVSEYAVPPPVPTKGSTVPNFTGGVGLMMSVYRNGSLWTTHCVNVDGRAGIRWYQINPVTRVVTQWGTVADLALSFYLPSLMVNSAGHVAMGFSGSNADRYMGCYFTGRRASDADGDMAIPQLFKAGESSFEVIDGIGRNRAGDYSYTTLDPTDQSTFWTIQEYAATHDPELEHWGTWIASLQFFPCGTSADCNDGNGCTVDACTSGLCDNKPSDGTACTGGICCHGICEAPICNSNADCDDHDICTGNDICENGGTCVAYCKHQLVPTLGCPCGDGVCSSGENPCTCLADCGPIMTNERLTGASCRDGIDNDCDGYTDCEDSDCNRYEQYCFCTGTNPRVCVDWDLPTKPVRNVNFAIDDVTSPDKPNVELRTGNNHWKLWSQRDRGRLAPADLGHITINPQLSAEDFSVRIAHGARPGAMNIASVALIKTNWTGVSNLSGKIDGNLGGDFILQGAAGVSGAATFSILGYVSGDIIIPTVNNVQIFGGVPESTTIRLDGFVGSRLAEFYTYGGDFAGDLSLPNGLPQDAIVRIYGQLASTGSVDFQGHDLTGTLTLRGGSAGQSGINNIGTLTGRLNLSNSVYSGSANLTSLGQVGEILMRDTTLNGTISVSGDWNGSLRLIHGNLGPTGVISIGGNMGGTGIISSGEMSGAILVAGNCAGGVGATGEVTGPIQINGVMSGDLCATNLSAGSALPSNITIGCGIGHDGTICGQEPVCPAANLVSSAAQPLNGTKDARQPYPIGVEGAEVALSERQGIGSPNANARAEDKIFMTLNNPDARAIYHGCWVLCETGPEPTDTGTSVYANQIACIAEVPDDQNKYQIKLERPISAQQWTTIRYLQGNAKVSYASLPGNINGDNYVNSTDMLWHIDCLNGIASHCGGLGLSTPAGPVANPAYRKDLDHSGVFSPGPDYGVTWMDLWNGGGNFLSWQNTSLPTNCCVFGCGGGGGGGMSMMAGGGGSMMMAGSGGEGGDEGSEEESFESELFEEEPSLAEQNAEVSDWLIAFVIAADPQDSLSQDIFATSMTTVTQWCVEFFSAEERNSLIARLIDNGLIFASQIGENAAAELAQTLVP